MEVYTSSKSILRYFDSSKWKCLVGVCGAIQILTAANILCFLMDRWDCLDDRTYAAKNIVSVIFMSGDFMAMVFYWTEFSNVVDMFDDPTFKIPYKISTQRKDLATMFDGKMASCYRIWKKVPAFYSLSLSVIPVLRVAANCILNGDDFQVLIKDKLATPLPFYYPQLIDRFGYNVSLQNILMYIMGYILQILFLIIGKYSVQLAFVVTFCALTNIEYELKLLGLSLLEMEDLINQPISGSNENKNISKVPLKKFLNYFVQHHQETQRKFEVVNRGIRWVAGVYSATAALYMCTSIYVIVQKDEITLKFHESILLLFWACAIYMFDVCGERIKTEDEKVKNALYECSWTDKPKWFKTSLLISLTRCSKPMDITPFGLFALDLNSFSKTMNAAYSYYHVISSL